MEMPAVEST